MRRKLSLTSGLALAALVLAGGAALATWSVGAGGDSLPVAITGSFRLTDGDGRTVTQDSFPGKWMLVYFGYTHCPDACPTALGDIANALDLLPPAERTKVVPVFITVDPERDTPAVMKDYVSGFGVTFVALSGNAEAIAQAEKTYRVYAARHPTEDGDYEMDHSSMIYVMNPQNRLVALFTHQSSAREIAAKLAQLGA